MLEGPGARPSGTPEERVAALLAPGSDLRGRFPAYLDRRERGGRELATQARHLLRALYLALLEAENTGVFVDVEDAASTSAVAQVLIVQWPEEAAPARLVHFCEVELGGLVLDGPDPLGGLAALRGQLVNDGGIYSRRRVG